MVVKIPPAPQIRIFLRDDFRLKTGGGPDFLVGVEEQLKFAQAGGINLVAACGEHPFDLTVKSDEPPPPMMHIWELPEWQSLYDAMYASSETGWYETLGNSIASESQELLINLRITYGTSPPTLSKEPNVYLYEEIRLKGYRVPNTYQRALNQFVREVRQRGWTWLWCTTQVTSEPQRLCMLWSAPSVDHFEEVLAESRDKTSFKTMMSHVADLTRRYMYPTFVEEIASRLLPA